MSNITQNYPDTFICWHRSLLAATSLVYLLSGGTVQPETISAQSYTKVSLLTTYNFLHDFDIIWVSETFLNSEIAANDPNLEIPGYNIYRADHPSNCKRGGIYIFYEPFSFKSTKYFKSKWVHQLWSQNY